VNGRPGVEGPSKELIVSSASFFIQLLVVCINVITETSVLGLYRLNVVKELVFDWLVRSLVPWFVRYAGCNFPKVQVRFSLNFGTDIEHLCQSSLLTFERSRSKFKVKTAVLNIFQS